MYRLNLLSRVSKCVSSSVEFIRSTTNARRNVHIYRNIHPLRLSTIEKCRFNEDHKSQKKRYVLFAVSLPTLIFNFLFDIDEDNEKEVPEVIMTIKRSILLMQVKYQSCCHLFLFLLYFCNVFAYDFLHSCLL